MGELEILRDIKRKVNYKILAKSLIAFCVLILLMWFINSMEWGKYELLRITLLTVISTIQASIIVFALWETIAKRTFAEEILHLADISNNIRISGIEKIYTNFLTIDEWRSLINESNRLTIAVSFAKTWRENNRDALKAMSDRGGKIKVILPNYRDENIMNELDRRFNFNSGIVKQNIIESG